MRYKPEDYIVEMVADIYEDHGIAEFGFDPIQLCKNMGHIVLPYSSFSDDEKRSLLYKQDKDGFSWYNPRLQKCEIYYNDNASPESRTKFTIPHEIGHIEYGHIFENEISPKMECIANEFARQLYMPHILLVKKEITTIHEIMSSFGVTEGYARIILDRLNNRMRYHGSEFLDSEYRILEAFDYNRSHKT